MEKHKLGVDLLGAWKPLGDSGYGLKDKRVGEIEDPRGQQLWDGGQTACSDVQGGPRPLPEQCPQLHANTFLLHSLVDQEEGLDGNCATSQILRDDGFHTVRLAQARANF